MPVDNKPLAYMAADMKTQTLVLRKTISDYPRCREIEAATNASAKTLCVTKKNVKHLVIIPGIGIFVKKYRLWHETHQFY